MGVIRFFEVESNLGIMVMVVELWASAVGTIHLWWRRRGRNNKIHASEKSTRRRHCYSPPLPGWCRREAERNAFVGIPLKPSSAYNGRIWTVG